ncbi:uncharacterized protein PITG_01582 [Phytophthora infestans T30-4]|uniref:Uncharacterized protein n=1 Tax=Phytophthora infestans (strain T30-4) TaxID=403677 RepID=D0MTK8_PHYIT|nr:uncharacterized protein PITG_01582 [Phytophthora infestans T30-4]EEY61305.1 hypothetical protein PITG_01582 [Phytophthora infestans T30-4]|eukprot:XP_002908222.1 hypothetical protein PITG_01582 [Phytophthora infestans T30-4]
MSILFDRGELGVAIYNALTTSLKTLQLRIADPQELEEVSTFGYGVVAKREFVALTHAGFAKQILTTTKLAKQLSVFKSVQLRTSSGCIGLDYRDK